MSRWVFYGTLLAVGWATVAARADSLAHVRVLSRDARAVAAELQLDGYDVLEPTIADDRFEAIVGPVEQAGLTERGLTVEILAIGRPFEDIQRERAVPTGYPNLDQIYAQMQAAAAAHPDICRFVDLTATLGVPPTYEGRHLYAVKISANVAEDEDEPAVLIVCTHHARELITPVIGLYTIDQLTSQYGIDPQLTSFVDDNEIWVAPMWNPDGYSYVFSTNNLWRKNRTPFTGGSGVDLNRNYPFGWSSACAGSTLVNSETYRGPSAASESETQTMMALGNWRHFTKVGDFHSYAREVRVGYGCWSYAFDPFLTSEASFLAATMSGYSASSSCCTAGDIHFHLANHGSLAFLWETGTSFQPSYATAQSETVLVFNSIRAFLARRTPISGHTVDALNGAPVSTVLQLVGVNFQNGETNLSEAQYGRYHVFVPNGSYQLRFSAPKYQTTTVPITVTATPTVQDVPLPRAYPLADVDCDGQVTFKDINAFVTALGGAAAYDTAYPACLWYNADTNCDRSVDFKDIDPFVACLSGNCNCGN